MNESGMWKTLYLHMRGLWHAQRHEDIYSSGIPDVSYAIDGICGWIELKYIKEWPKRPTTIIRVKHLTKQQRLWLRQRGKRCDNVFLFLRVNYDWLLFRHTHVNMIGSLNKEDLFSIAEFHCGRIFDKEKFMKCIR